MIATSATSVARDDPFERPSSELSAEVLGAAERGLRFLARQQDPSGAWIGDVGYKVNQDYNVRAVDVPHVGVTALAGMAFLAGGHLPGRGEYGAQVDRAVDFLSEELSDLGYFSAHHTRMYSHALATLFFAEVYGTTRRADVREELERAVGLIVASQNQQGSWRYEPFTVESDMSMTVGQLMALRAARNIGIHVSSGVMERAVEYIQRSLVRDEDLAGSGYELQSDYYAIGPGAFRYQLTEGSRSSFALTAAGVTSMFFMARYDSAGLRKSLRYLEDTQSLVSRSWQGHYFYYYGHYYAVQAMFTTGGDIWDRYWKRISTELVGDQQADGSWLNTVGPGSSFATASACIVLQTPYRYLPILQR